MKILAIIINFLFPGLGTLIVKKWTQGFFQMVLSAVGIALSVTGIGLVVAVPLLIGVFIWSIITVVNTPQEAL